ncbi:MAG: FG-GAP-like repeat-containing protein [Candidatus Electryonea clarkiae]|nr:FG-GAP-like repeat-containing protein [Candidatus Electryonea clarkiae]MDP8287458.1 FG-GAP-like repeat-containing protein [Candidatus Electryonea clarkiae]
MKNILPISILFILILTTSGFSQVEFTEHTLDQTFSGARYVTAADIDNDDDIDIIGGAEGGSDITWWENSGILGWEAHVITSNFSGVYSLYAIDMDEDNDVDIVGSAWLADRVSWFENEGDNWEEHVIDNGFNTTCTVVAADFDGDNDIDVAAGCRGSRVYWYENDDFDWTRQSVTTSIADPWNINIADVNNDGAMDILSVAYDGSEISWFENDGDGDFAEHVIRTGNGPRWVYGTDVDGDGDTDILCAMRDAGIISVYENDGDEDFTEHVIDDFYTANCIFAADIDADGEKDVIASSFDRGTIRWWANEGDLDFDNGNDITTNFRGANCVYALDLDDDLDIDIMGTAYYDSEICIWENDLDIVPGGSLEGTVSDLLNAELLEQVQVIVFSNEEPCHETSTDAQGFYEFERLMVGEYELQFAKECFCDTLYLEVTIEEDETTTLDHLMTYPEMELDPTEINLNLMNVEETMVNISLTNFGYGYLDYSAQIYLQGPGEDYEPVAPGNHAALFELETEETRNRGIVFIYGHFFVSGSDRFDPLGPNKIYQYSRYGDELIDTFDQPVPSEDRSAQGFYGLTWDGDFLYGVDEDIMYQMEVIPTNEDAEGSIELEDSWEIPVEEPRFLTYDPDNDLFWMGGRDSVIVAVDRDGETVYEYEREFSPRGLGWNPDDEDGFKLYFACRRTAETTTTMIKMDPENGNYEELFQYEVPDGNFYVCSADISSTWHPIVKALVTLVDDGEQDYIQIWVIETNDTNFEILNPSGTVNAETEIDVDFVFRGEGLLVGDYPFFVEFENNACEDENNYIAVNMIVSGVGEEHPADPENLDLPLEWSFKGAYPNPFNPLVNIEFSLRSDALVQARVYNLMGQEVAVLADHMIGAGHQTLAFDGSNLASGMYILQFNAGPIAEMKKLILLK